MCTAMASNEPPSHSKLVKQERNSEFWKMEDEQELTKILQQQNHSLQTQVTASYFP